MPKKNISGNAYGLTLLCPIKNGSLNDQSYAEILRDYLENLPLDGQSPMAKIPNTYFARFYVLNDVFYEGFPVKEEHLKSKYLVFSSNFHGDRDTYVRGMWDSDVATVKTIKTIWRDCVAFDEVNTAEDFIDYVKKCQVDNNLFFNGSTGDSLAEQLKALYLKQEFTRFAYENQGLSAQNLQENFNKFVERTDPSNLAGPSWSPGVPAAEPTPMTVVSPSP